MYSVLVHIYLEYQSVCPLVRIGTPHPLSRKRVCPPLEPKGEETHSPEGEGAGGPNSDDWRKNLVILQCNIIVTYRYLLFNK